MLVCVIRSYINNKYINITWIIPAFISIAIIFQYGFNRSVDLILPLLVIVSILVLILNKLKKVENISILGVNIITPLISFWVIILFYTKRIIFIIAIIFLGHLLLEVYFCFS